MVSRQLSVVSCQWSVAFPMVLAAAVASLAALPAAGVDKSPTAAERVVNDLVRSLSEDGDAAKSDVPRADQAALKAAQKNLEAALKDLEAAERGTVWPRMQIPERRLGPPNKPSYRFRSAQDKERAINERRGKVALAREEVARLSPQPKVLHPHELKTGQQGAVSWQAKVWEVIGPSQVILDVYFDKNVGPLPFGARKFSVLVLVEKYSTADLVDDKDITLRGEFIVKGTARVDGKTMFVIRPFKGDPKKEKKSK